MERLILFLIRLKFGLKKWEPFRFTNQKSDDIYYFGNYNLLKLNPGDYFKLMIKSGVSLNWLLDPACKVEKVRLKNE